MDLTIFDVAEAALTPALVRGFKDQLAVERLHVESLTIELKRERTGNNVAEAVCAFANGSGGIVLLGVDEDDPGNVPGVARREVEAVVNQLRGGFEPVYVPLVVAVTAADAPDRVVVVLRVDPLDVPPGPIMWRGIALIRSPGRNDRATRQQLVDLVGRSGANTLTQHSGSGLPSTYMPEVDNGHDPRHDIPMLRLRVASGVSLRPISMTGVVLTTQLRDHLRWRVDASEVANWAAGHLAPADPVFWQINEMREHRFVTSRPVARRFPPDVALGLRARLDGSQLSWAVDVDIAEPGEVAEESPYLRLEYVVSGILNLVPLVRDVMRSTVLDHLGQPVLSTRPTVVWAQPRDSRADVRLGLGEFVRTAANTVSGVQFELEQDGDLDAGVHLWLYRLLLASGADFADQDAT